jgi:hypothetical protein
MGEMKRCRSFNSLIGRKALLLSLLFLTMPFLAACGPDTPLAATPTLTSTLAAETPTPTLTPAPTLTPTPETPLAILLAEPGMAPDALQTTLAGLAQTAGMKLEVRPSLATTELGNVRIVVALPPDPGLATLASAAPATKFLAIDIPGLQPAANLSLIHTADRPDQLGFLAGHLAAVITDDWRTGVISEANTPGGEAARIAFSNGMTYFCGLCLSYYPPFPNTGYPVQVELQPGAGADGGQAAIDSLSTWQVETVFVYPPLADEQLLAQLVEAGFNLITTGAPAEAWKDHWVASLDSQDVNQVLPDLWGRLLAGEAGTQVTLSLGLSNVNPDLVSPGRQQLVEAMLADLMVDFIDTGVDPQTGESQ